MGNNKKASNTKPMEKLGVKVIVKVLQNPIVQKIVKSKQPTKTIQVQPAPIPLPTNTPSPPPSSSPTATPTQERTLITKEQLDQFEFPMTDAEIADFNKYMKQYGITDPKSIAAFMATIAKESGKGSIRAGDDDNLLRENGSDSYFASQGYNRKTRGAGYMQLTGKDVDQAKFLESVGINPSTIDDPATYIAKKYPIESACWYWGKYDKANGKTLNQYIVDYKDFNNAYLVSQYFTNGWPKDPQTGATVSDDYMRQVRLGNAEEIDGKLKINNPDTEKNTTVALPTGWADRKTYYDEARKIWQ